MTPSTRCAWRLATVLPVLVACSGSSDVTIGDPAGSAGAAGVGPFAGAAGSAGAPSEGGSGAPTEGSAGQASGPAAGAPASGGGGTGDTTADAAAPAAPEAGPTSPPGFFDDGFLQAGPWGGYMFTYADTLGSTVSPMCTANGCTPVWGAQPCAAGTVVQDADGASYIGLAFHVNAPKSGSRGTWSVTGTGLLVSVSNAPSRARVSLQEPSPKGNDQRYCAPLPEGGSGTIPWGDFKTWCWGDTAHPSVALKQGTKLDEVAVQVAGMVSAPVPYDLCLVNMSPQ